MFFYHETCWRLCLTSVPQSLCNTHEMVQIEGEKLETARFLLPFGSIHRHLTYLNLDAVPRHLCYHTLSVHHPLSHTFTGSSLTSILMLSHGTLVSHSVCSRKSASKRDRDIPKPEAAHKKPHRQSKRSTSKRNRDFPTPVGAPTTVLTVSLLAQGSLNPRLQRNRIVEFRNSSESVDCSSHHSDIFRIPMTRFGKLTRLICFFVSKTNTMTSLSKN